jgi:hypothetical protein
MQHKIVANSKETVLFTPMSEVSAPAKAAINKLWPGAVNRTKGIKEIIRADGKHSRIIVYNFWARASLGLHLGTAIVETIVQSGLLSGAEVAGTVAEGPISIATDVIEEGVGVWVAEEESEHLYATMTRHGVPTNEISTRTKVILGILNLGPAKIPPFLWPNIAAFFQNGARLPASVPAIDSEDMATASQVPATAIAA